MTLLFMMSRYDLKVIKRHTYNGPVKSDEEAFGRRRRPAFDDARRPSIRKPINSGLQRLQSGSYEDALPSDPQYDQQDNVDNLDKDKIPYLYDDHMPISGNDYSPNQQNGESYERERESQRDQKFEDPVYLSPTVAVRLTSLVQLPQEAMMAGTETYKATTTTGKYSSIKYTIMICCIISI